MYFRIDLFLDINLYCNIRYVFLSFDQIKTHYYLLLLMLVMVLSSTASQPATLIQRTLLYPVSFMFPSSLLLWLIALNSCCNILCLQFPQWFYLNDPINISAEQYRNKKKIFILRTDDIVMMVLPSVCPSSVRSLVGAALYPFRNATSFFFDWWLNVLKMQRVKDKTNAETKR